MAPDRFLEEYGGQSTNEMIALASDYRLDSIIIAFHQAMDQKAARVGTASLTEEEQIILAVEALETEVNNGGYGQFFVNACEYVSTIVPSLDRIACPATARITQAAIAALGIRGTLTVDAIERAMAEEDETRDVTMNELDSAYCDAKEDIAGRLFEFIKANRDRIVLTP
ncbi:MAG: DUF4375 domain-containing protein [Phycisphaerae bacterium]|nr:DUF4375 domain-containing protein [Phycisphaerae bacterium]